MYRIKIKTSAFKELERLGPRIRARVKSSIEGLKEAPRPTGARKLTGKENLYRIRVGDYRVVYGVEDEAKTVTVIAVRKREVAYR
ncbi:MAG: type II toxin-antitoxin system RelE/ParE family toxin [candidate division Zixibacteria bacterium]|nr:type II toxin-antitoxin system RelE/ParE family toxin [candidate division Zixibacteria bacterium]